MPKFMPQLKSEAKGREINDIVIRIAQRHHKLSKKSRETRSGNNGQIIDLPSYSSRIYRRGCLQEQANAFCLCRQT
jgi:hypothetical protein